MSLSDKLTGIAAGLGLVQMEGEPAEASHDASPTPAVSAAPAPTSNASGNQELIETIKTRVFSTAPLVRQFLKHYELLKAAIPNDEVARMRAALAVMETRPEQIISELSGAVNAAFELARQSSAKERDQVRSQKIGGTNKEMETTRAELDALKAQLAKVQGEILAKEARVSELTQVTEQVENDLRQQDASIEASFADVGRFVSNLQQSLTSLK